MAALTPSKSPSKKNRNRKSSVTTPKATPKGPPAAISAEAPGGNPPTTPTVIVSTGGSLSGGDSVGSLTPRTPVNPLEVESDEEEKLLADVLRLENELSLAKAAEVLRGKAEKAQRIADLVSKRDALEAESAAKRCKPEVQTANLLRTPTGDASSSGTPPNSTPLPFVLGSDRSNRLVNVKKSEKPGDSPGYTGNPPVLGSNSLLGINGNTWGIIPLNPNEDGTENPPPGINTLPPANNTVVTANVGPQQLQAPVDNTHKSGFGGLSHVPRPPTPSELKNLGEMLERSDYGASYAAFSAGEVFQGLLEAFKAASMVKYANRNSRIRGADGQIVRSLTDEQLLGKLVAGLAVPVLAQRVMGNPRALLSLSCFQASNVAHFSWIDATTSGCQQPRLLPFPVGLTGRDLLVLFHKFIMLVSCVDVCFGIALSNLYTVVESLLLSHEPIVASRYLEETRQSFDNSGDLSVFLSLQDPILSKILQVISEQKPDSGKPGAALGAEKPPGVFPRYDVDDRRGGFENKFRDQFFPRGKKTSFVHFQDDDRDRDRERDHHDTSAHNRDIRERDRGRQHDRRTGERGQERVDPVPVRLMRGITRDSVKQFVCCDGFNEAAGCSHPLTCRFGHVCCFCGSADHNYPNHGSGGTKPRQGQLAITGNPA